MRTSNLKPQTSNPFWLVRWRGYAVKFHTNLGGKIYSLVKDPDATLFEFQSEAVNACHRHHLRDYVLEAAKK